MITVESPKLTINRQFYSYTSPERFINVFVDETYLRDVSLWVGESLGGLGSLRYFG